MAVHADIAKLPFEKALAELEQIEPDEAREEVREWLAGEIPADVVMDPKHDNHSIMLSAKFVGEGEEESDDDARFGDDDAVSGDGDRTGRLRED